MSCEANNPPTFVSKRIERHLCRSSIKGFSSESFEKIEKMWFWRIGVEILTKPSQSRAHSPSVDYDV